MWVFVYLHIRGDSNVGFCIYLLGVIVMWVFCIYILRDDSNVGFCVFTY